MLPPLVSLDLQARLRAAWWGLPRFADWHQESPHAALRFAGWPAPLLNGRAVRPLAAGPDECVCVPDPIPDALPKKVRRALQRLREHETLREAPDSDPETLVRILGLPAGTPAPDVHFDDPKVLHVPVGPALLRSHWARLADDPWDADPRLGLREPLPQDLAQTALALAPQVSVRSARYFDRTARVAVHESSALCLVGEGFAQALDAVLAPEPAEGAEPQAFAAAVWLLHLGVLRPQQAAVPLSAAALAHWQRAGVSSLAAWNALGRAGRVYLTRPLPALQAALEAAGFACVSELGEARCVVLVAPFDPGEAERVALRLRQHGVTVLVCGAGPAFPGPGPVLLPEGPCFACFRRGLAHGSGASLLRLLHGEEGSLAALVESEPAGARDLLLGVLGGVIPAGSYLSGRVPSRVRHVLSSLPSCPHCGSPEPFDGTLDASLESRLRPLLAGPLSAVGALGDTIYDFDSEREWAFTARAGIQHRSVSGGPPVPRAAAMGKGGTAQQARDSALAEAIERMAGQYFAPEDLPKIRWCRPGGNEQPSTVLPHHLHPFSPAQYARAAAGQTGTFRFLNVPSGGPALPTEGVFPFVAYRAWGCEETVLVPASNTWYGYPGLGPAGTPSPSACCSNGCAAGPTLADAVARGYCELLERHAVALWLFRRLPRPGVDLASFEDQPALTAARDRFAKAGRSLHVLDLTVDPSLPSFVAWSALLQPTDSGATGLLFGSGCAPSATHAVLRAYRECLQGFPANGGTWDSQETSFYEEARFFGASTPETLPWLLPADGPLLGPDDYPQERPITGEAFADRCAASAEHLGSRLYWLDLTRQDLRLPVVRVVTPGLAHFWPRFGSPLLVPDPADEARMFPLPWPS